jgi:hypothetical protein
MATHSVLVPTLRDATLRVAPQGEVFFDLGRERLDDGLDDGFLGGS